MMFFAHDVVRTLFNIEIRSKLIFEQLDSVLDLKIVTGRYLWNVQCLFQNHGFS